jgi:predicted RNA-binding protein
VVVDFSSVQNKLEVMMCQMSVILDNNGRQEKVMDEVTRLEVTSEGVVLSTFFDEPKLVPGAQVREIDFMKTTVFLSPAEIGEG